MNLKFHWKLPARRSLGGGGGIGNWKFLDMANSNGVDISQLLPFTEKFETVGDLISLLLPWLFNIAVVLVFLFLLWGGLQYIFSQGDPKAAQNAQRRITYAIIGLVVLILAFLVVQFIESFTGIPIFGK